jgi:HNH endonuclease
VASGAPGESYRQLTLDGSRPRSSRVAAEEEAIRFWAKVVIDPRPGGCQHWIAAIGDDGYGRFQAGSGPTARTVRAHRWAFEVSTGLHPARRALLHACDETGCVALDHLVVGTQAENVAAMHRRGRGWRRHTGRTDRRGPAGRARAIRAALREGWNLAAYATAVAAGDPFPGQLVLPVTLPGAEPAAGGIAS